MLKKQYRQVYSIFSICLMLFQSVAPAAFLVTPAYAATDAAVVTVSDVILDFSAESNEFTLAGAASDRAEFVLTYNDENDETPEEAVLGTVEISDGVFSKTVYAGTCSGEDCIAHEVTSGTLQFINADYSAEFTVTDETLWLQSGEVATVATVETGKTYVAPQNDDVTVTFTKLPQNPGSLSIEEITLTDEQVEMLGALSNVAYDITSSMENGTFEYELTLPKPENSEGELQVVYAKSVEELEDAEVIHNDSVAVDEAVVAKGLDHFTVFVVTPLDPSNTGTPAGTTVVTSDSSNWVYYNHGPAGAATEFVNGIDTPPLGVGSAKMSSGPIGSKAIMVTNAFDGILLSDIHTFSYDTYTENRSGTVGLYANLYIDTDNDDLVNYRLDFEPGSLVTENTWETWNLISQTFFVSERVGSDWVTRPAATWTDFITAHPDATFGGWGGGFTLAFNAGDTGTAAYAGFTGYLDNIVLNDFEYDLEPDVYPPTQPTGMRILDNEGNILGCDGYTNHRTITVDWDDNTENEDFDHFEYQNKEENTIATPIISEFTGDTRDQDGYYKYRVRAIDTAGNPSEWSNWCGVTLDRIAPDAPTLIEPENNSEVNGAILLSDWSDVDGATSYFYESYHNAGATQVRFNDVYTESEKTATNVGNAVFWWRVKAIDMAGNISPWSELWKVTVDNNAPATPTWGTIYKGHGVNPSNEIGCDGYTNSTQITLKWNDNTETDLDGYWFGTQFNPKHQWFDAGQTVKTANMTPGNNPYYYTVIAVDNAGNESLPSEQCGLILDTDAPNVAVTAPGAGTVAGTVEVRGTVEDENSHHYWFVIQNSSGTTVGGPGVVNDTNSFADALLLNWNTTIVPDGVYTIKLEARDSADNKDAGSSSWIEVVVDNTAPSTTLTSPTDGNYSNTGFTIAGTSTDANGVNFVNLYYQLDGDSDWTLINTVDNTDDDSPYAFSYDWTPATSGVYNIMAAGTDLAGNIETSAYVYGVTYDVSNPMVAILAPSADSAFSGQFTVNGTAFDALSGIDKVRVRFRNESDNALVATFWATYNSGDDTWSIDINDGVNTLADGYYRVRATAFDLSGNTIGTVVRRIHVDSVEPSSTITTFDLLDGEEVETNSFDGLIEGTATDDNSGVAEVNLEIKYTPFDSSDSQYWNGTDWQDAPILVTATGEDAWLYQIDQDFVEDGIYDVTSHATDRAGNVESTYTIKIVYDKTIPTVLLAIDPASPDGNNGWYRVTMPTITLTASDNHDVDRIEYRWNSAAWNTYTSPLTPPGEGQNILYYRAIDTVGNPSDEGRKDVKYDKTNPAGEPLNVHVDNITSTNADGKWQAPSDDSDVFQYKLEWKHDDGTSHGVTVSRTTFEHNLDKLKDGVWTFSVRAMDAAGNYTQKSVKFRVGPEPASSDGSTTTDGTVLGVSTDPLVGTGVGGTFGTQTAVGQDGEDADETQQDDTLNGAAANTDEDGSVLGESTCAPWLYYLPLLMLLLQVLVILGFEFFRRGPGFIKLLVAGGTTLAVIVAFNFLRDMGCYVDGSWLASIAQWFPGISIAFGVITKLIAYGFIEEA